MVLKIEQTYIDYLYRSQMKLESDFSFISNHRDSSDDVTLFKTISNEVTNRQFMVSIWIYIDCMPLWWQIHTVGLKHFP